MLSTLRLCLISLLGTPSYHWLQESTQWIWWTTVISQLSGRLSASEFLIPLYLCRRDYNGTTPNTAIQLLQLRTLLTSGYQFLKTFYQCWEIYQYTRAYPCTTSSLTYRQHRMNHTKLQLHFSLKETTNFSQNRTCNCIQIQRREG